MDVPRNWRTQAARYRLKGGRCQSCGTLAFPARRVCLRCGSEEMVEHAFSGNGVVYAHSVVYSAPSGFAEQAPYIVALVRLAEGPLVTAQLTDIEPDEVHIDMPVEMVTRRLYEDGPQGVVVYGYKFRPPLTLGVDAPYDGAPTSV